jgi:phospholipid-binding lipoprotein MlaA
LRDTGRFLLNSTLGIAGIFDIATAIGLEANDEDLGQTLAV